MHSPSPPDFAVSEVQEIALQHFGLKSHVSLLAAERDQNFKLIDETGVHFVLKITNGAEDPKVTEFQTLLLEYVRKRDVTLPVPDIIETKDGDSSAIVVNPNGVEHTIRVISWLDGRSLRDVNVTESLATNLGKVLARLDGALSDFQHPAQDHEFNWDMKRLPSLRPHADYLEDDTLRQQVYVFLDHFENRIMPCLPAVRWQVIYNDLNPSNVLVDANNLESVSGIFDFGDAVLAPLVMDLAVACAYQMETGDNPFRLVQPLVSAYNQVIPLQETEMTLLYDLIRARHVMTVIITNWRASLYPENRSYIMRNCPQAIAVLDRLALLDDKQAVDQIRSFA